MNETIPEQYRQARLSGTLSGIAYLMYLGLAFMFVLLVLTEDIQWGSFLPRFLPLVAIAVLLNLSGRLILKRHITALSKKDSANNHKEGTGE